MANHTGAALDGRTCKCMECAQARVEAIQGSQDELYSKGFDDGVANTPTWALFESDDNYMAGWADGVSERRLSSATRPVDDEFYLLNAPPEGFTYLGEKRVPGPGDFYLTKNQGAKFQTKTRGNNQTRHILVPAGHEGHEIVNYYGDAHCQDCSTFIRASYTK